MKKLLYVAMMALTVGLMASCAAKSGSSDFYKNGKEPEIDLEKATVNGVKYDDETNKCWKYTVSTTVAGITGTADTYTWGTEFVMVAACEYAMYTAAQAPLTKAKYSYAEVPGKDQDACEELAEKNNK